MARKLWAHQQYAFDKYKNRESFGLLFPTGTGKTLTACRIAEAKDRPVLIIAPNALCKQWADELTNKDEESRISEKDWNVLVCTSKTKNTKKFKEALEKLCEE
jgi:superfamily II DNA or RNA helicase